MHDDEVVITEGQVAALVADELPQWARMAVQPIGSGGTVNAVFRIGEELTARFPLRADDPGSTRTTLEREAAAAAELRRVSPFPVPRPVHVGHPGHGYPLPWSAQTWLDGTTATPTSCERSLTVAYDLATLIRALRRTDTVGRRFSGTGRGGSLIDHDEWMQQCFAESDRLFDTGPLRRMWATVRTLPREDADVMSHTDLIPGNLLVEGDRLVGVLDGGGFRAADPALDLVCAWHLLGPEARDALRVALECSELQWERGRAWALEQAMGLVWYYADTNPPMAEMGRVTLQRLLADGS
ncbi:MAG TPA: aminoglycoside phosphotransferase family protein [Propionibacteriaceae bacterium]|nr:aminoglycoside phosphotransferase family protein [Propionibacteriaceae bacterium]